jgi:hypothetical protein
VEEEVIDDMFPGDNVWQITNMCVWQTSSISWEDLGVNQTYVEDRKVVRFVVLSYLQRWKINT